MSGPRPVLQVGAPFAGTVVALADLPDPVFSTGVVGPGLAIQPARDLDRVEVVAPCDGLVHAALPHAVMLVGDHGRSVLVHLGVRTGQLQVGERIRVGQRVVAGQALLVWTLGPGRTVDLASPVVALQAAADQVLAVAEPGELVSRGQPVLFWS